MQILKMKQFPPGSGVFLRRFFFLRSTRYENEISSLPLSMKRKIQSDLLHPLRGVVFLSISQEGNLINRAKTSEKLDYCFFRLCFVYLFRKCPQAEDNFVAIVQILGHKAENEDFWRCHGRLWMRTCKR
ncbi:hypothetical protein TNCV_3753071 [Trichonephila clavipes]|nr:hypothetical protein TNCV_3753071 [Trichonephila clavipes]